MATLRNLCNNPYWSSINYYDLSHYSYYNESVNTSTKGLPSTTTITTTTSITTSLE